MIFQTKIKLCNASLRYHLAEILLKIESCAWKVMLVGRSLLTCNAFLAHDLKPKTVVSVTSDGAPYIVGDATGFIQFFDKETKNPVVQFH